jgi:hypothetical protein
MLLALLLAGGLVALKLGAASWWVGIWGESGKPPGPIESGTAVEAATASSAMAEFWIRSAVNRIPAPPGTGLPSIRKVVIAPLHPLMYSLHLEVSGVDNPAWTELPNDQKLAYADEVLQAVARAGPSGVSDDAQDSAWIAVKIWDWFSVPKNMSDDELEDIACKRVVYLWDHWECFGVSVSVNAELPAHPAAAAF